MKKVSNIGNDILGINLVYQTAGGGGVKTRRSGLFKGFLNGKKVGKNCSRDMVIKLLPKNPYPFHHLSIILVTQNLVLIIVLFRTSNRVALNQESTIERIFTNTANQIS